MSYKAPNHQPEEKIMLPRDEKDHLYEPKPNKKVIRILTVGAYVLCVSMAAIVLSLYYLFFWDPSNGKAVVAVKPTIGCAQFLQNRSQVTEREFREIAGIDKKIDAGRVVPASPSMGPLLPTAVIKGDQVFEVKEIEIGPGKQFVVANLILGSSTASSPAATEMMIDNSSNDDTEYQEDEMDFEIEESSGQGEEVPPPTPMKVNRTVPRTENDV